MRQFFSVFVALLILALPAAAQERTIRFSGLERPVTSPERGWWGFAVENFRNAPEADLKNLRQNGITLVYGIVRLDDFRDKPLSGGLLADLEGSFGKARNAGIKVILRFAYNYPASSQEYENAKDAPLDIVLEHIEQLAPVIAANADTITVMQAGFIGAWGEGHSSSNGLDSPQNKALIRDKLLEEIPEGIDLQWRYASDLIAWDKRGKRGRFGMHNDCFLSSPTDVGTYSGNPDVREDQRAAIAKMTASTFFSGETCDAQKTEIRSGCGAILNEGERFHLSALGIDYYKAFHNRWKSDGCYSTIAAKMGYRLRLVQARIAEGKIRITIRNDGWARVMRERKLKLRARGEVLTFGPETLDDIKPGESVVLTATLPGGGIPDRLCVFAPDPSTRLASDQRYSIRFANADKRGQSWDNGQFCFRTK